MTSAEEELWDLGDTLYNRLKTKGCRGRSLGAENYLGNGWPSRRDKALETRLLKWVMRFPCAEEDSDDSV